MIISEFHDFQAILKVDVLFKPSPFLSNIANISDDIHSNPFCTKVKSMDSRLKKCRMDCFSDLHEKFKNKTHKVETKECHAGGQLICIPVYNEFEYIGTILVGPFQNKLHQSIHKSKEINILLNQLKSFDLQELKAIENIGVTIGEKINSVIIQKLSKEKINIINPKVQKVIQFLKSNLHRSLAIEDVSEYIHMSSSRLMHLFKSEMGKTVISYFNELKLIEAEKYLIYTNYNLNKICELLDFKSPSYFGILFNKHSGMTPLKFRNANQKVIEP